MNIMTRRELITTYDLKRLDQVRCTLRANGIRYYIKTVNRRSPSPFNPGRRAQTGTAFEKMEYEYTYYIYVHMNDLEQAKSMVHGEGLW